MLMNYTNQSCVTLLKIYNTVIEIIYCSGVTRRLESQTLSALVADGNGVIVVLYILEMTLIVIGSC
jgi:hypothetical protein